MLVKKALDEGADYIHSLSGQDFPCRPSAEFNDFFEKNTPKSFMHFDTEQEASIWRNGLYQQRYRYFHFHDMPGRGKLLPDILMRVLEKTFSYLPCRSEIPGITMGWSWFSWHRSLAEYIMRYFSKNPQWLRRCRFTRSADEFIFHTILNGKESTLNLSRLDPTRYIDWHPVRPTATLPLVLDETDYSSICNSRSFFCRKVHPITSARLLDLLEARVNKL